MYKPKVFLVGREQDELITLEETNYVTEDVLQDLLCKYPDLLPGEQINPDNPRRWLLVTQEMGVPDDTGESNRWWLDHLFLDQDGTPTFVECKRATDTRIRREVVAQMLDYAANGVEYWSIDKIRQAASETAKRQGKSVDSEIAALLGADAEQVDVESYWALVEENLRSHQIRLLFVADSTPKELRRLVEFLNEQMQTVEVLAVEIKQFTHENQHHHTALVPRVIGFTEAARTAKQARPRRGGRTTRDQFLDKCAPGVREFYEAVLDLAGQHGHLVNWGEVGFSVRAHLPGDLGLATFLYCYPPSSFSFYFEPTLGLTENESSSLRTELLDFGAFQESGKHTLHSDVAEDNLELMHKILSFIQKSWVLR